MHEYNILLVFNELGSAQSGNDILMDDGKYHKCRNKFYVTYGDRVEAEEYARHTYGKEPDLYKLFVYGPYAYN